jgi:hypothetical protein
MKVGRVMVFVEYEDGPCARWDYLNGPELEIGEGTMINHSLTVSGPVRWSTGWTTSEVWDRLKVEFP